jgi:hypothetical protein
MMVVIMMVVVARLLDQEAEASQAAPDRFFGFKDNLFGEVERSHGLLKDRKWDSQMKNGGTKHVAADAGGAVEMEVGRRHGKRID